MTDRVQLLQQAIIHGGQRAFDNVPSILQNVLQDKLWLEKQDRDGQPFKSFEAFAAYPLWWGLESSIDDLRAFCRKRPDVVSMIDDALSPLASHGANQHSGGDGVTSSRGNSGAYRRKRLKRDRQDLYDKFSRGEITLIGAEIEAGFRGPTVTVGGKPKTSAHAIVSRLGRDYAQELIDALSDILIETERRRTG